MRTREVTISIKVTEEEALRAHALADATDESIGRWLRRVIAREYLHFFGDAPPPAKKTRMGRPRTKTSAKAAR